MKKRIALLIPHSDLTLESDLKNALPPNYSLHSQRLLLADVSEQAERQMVEQQLPPAIKILAGIADFAAAVFGCTSASAIDGAAGMAKLEKTLAHSFNCPAISALGAVLRRLEKHQAAKIALLTPYSQAVNAFMGRTLAEFGIDVVYNAGMGLTADREIAAVPPEQVAQFAADHLLAAAAKKSDMLFISCTNLRAVEALPELQQKSKLPIVTSNQAIIDYIIGLD